MAVSKRMRYEVLRRDDYRCRYCGATAGEGARLVLDHVVPVAIGGTDEPGNLVACCQECNAGKGSTVPDQQLVDDVTAAALRYASAVRQAAEDMRSLVDEERDYADTFMDEWQTFRYGFNLTKVPPLPEDWRASVARWHRAGLPVEALVDAVHKAIAKVGPTNAWIYMCGICWSRVREIQERALRILADEDEGG